MTGKQELKDCLKRERVYIKEMNKMDKKMHKITESMKKAGKILSKAESKNEKLVKEDKEVRDPIIKKCKKVMKGKK